MDLSTTIIILWILCIHYVADFIYQDEKWAVNKWNDFQALISHTLVYSTLLTAGVYSFLTPVNLLYFFLITLFTHTSVDYVTSKIVHNMFEKKHYGSEIPNFGGFSIIGLDQLIHFFTLILTFYYLYE